MSSRISISDKLSKLTSAMSQDEMHPRPGPLPDWLSEAVASVLADLQQPSPVNVRFGYSPDPELDTLGTLLIFSPNGTIAGFGIETFARDARLLVEVAEGVQDRFFELPELGGQARRPRCPGHKHPAHPAEVGGEALWICPRDGRPISPIGAVRV